MKHLLFITITSAFAIAGCAPSAPVIKKTFYGEPRLPESISIIKRSEEKAEFQATLSKYSASPTGLAMNALEPNTVELHVDPGEYSVVLHCRSGPEYSDPQTAIRARAGMIYEVACERNTFTGKSVRAKVSNTYSYSDQRSDVKAK